MKTDYFLNYTKLNRLFLSLSLLVLVGLCISSTINAEERKQLSTVEIIGEAGELSTIPGSAHYVDDEELETFEYDDVQQILSTVPGVYFRQEDGYGLRPNIGLRGATTERSQKVTIMEDTVLIGPAPYSAPAAYYFPSVTRMSAVEVFKGPSAIQYGPNTVGGAINLVTQDIPEAAQGMLDIGLGQFSYNKIHSYYGASNERFGWLIEGLKVKTDGFKDLPNDDDTGFDKNNVMAKFRFNSDKSWRHQQQFDLKLNYSDENSDETYLGLSDQDFANNPNQRYAASQNALMDWEHKQILLSHAINITPEHLFTSKLYHHQFERAWTKLNAFDFNRSLSEILSDPKDSTNQIFYDVLAGTNDSLSPAETLLVGTNDRAFVSQGLQFTHQWLLEAFDAYHNLEIGLRFHQDEIERMHSEEEFLMQSGTLVSNNIINSTVLNLHEAEAISLHIRDEIEKDKMTITLGLRGEFIDTRANNTLPINQVIKHSTEVIIPGIGIFYQVEPRWGVLAGFNKGFVPVGPGQNSNIDPEESNNFEFGFRYHSKEQRGEIIGFYNDYQNLLATCSNATGCGNLGQQFNGGEANIYGLEALWQNQWQTSKATVPVKVSYTYTSAEFDNSFTTSFALWGDQINSGDPIPYIPEQQLSLNIGYDLLKISHNLLVKYTGEMHEQAGSGGDLEDQKTKALTVLDLASQYNFDAKTQVYLGIDNLLDKQEIISRRPFGARPNKPRQVKIGLKYDF